LPRIATLAIVPADLTGSRLLRLIVALLALLTGSAALADEVVVFAAASLQGPLDQAVADWAAATGHQVTISYAGSAALARQIAAGAPADLFISAAPEWVDSLAADGLLTGGPRVLFGNRLVLIAPAGEATGPGGLDAAAFGTGLIATGHVASVPAGVYARAALESLGLWPALQDRIVQVDNVRVALALVARGEVERGIVYASDAASSPEVAVIAQFPAASHPPILYPAATVSDSPLAPALLDHLAGPAALAIFLAAGFTPPPAP
jgi:molybdate transport system substrate-binding protein